MSRTRRWNGLVAVTAAFFVALSASAAAQDFDPGPKPNPNGDASIGTLVISGGGVKGSTATGSFTRSASTGFADWNWFHPGGTSVVSGCGRMETSCTVRIDQVAGASRFNPATGRYESPAPSGWVPMGVQGAGSLSGPSSPAIFRRDWFVELGEPAATPAQLRVRLNAVDQPLVGDVFPLTLEFRNTGNGAGLKDIAPVNAYGFEVASDFYPAGQQGAVQVLGPPAPAFPATLGALGTSTHTVSLLAAQDGKVGLKITATANNATTGAPTSSTFFGEVEIGTQAPTGAKRTALVAGGTGLFLGRASIGRRKAQARYALELYKTLRARLSTRARRFYFGSPSKLIITPYERGLARLKGMAPELMALMTPNKRKLYENGEVFLTPQQFARFQQVHNGEMVRLTGDYLGGVATSTKETIARELDYWLSSSVEAQGRRATDIALWRELNAQDGDYLLSALASLGSPAQIKQALADSDAALRAGFERAVDGLLQARDARVAKLVKLADSDPEAFIDQLAADEAKLAFETEKLIAEILTGDAAFSLAGKALAKGPAALARLAEAMGVTSKGKAKTLAKGTEIAERSAAVGPSFLDDLGEEAKELINLRRLEDLGGMPLPDVEVTKGMISQVNARLKQVGFDTEVDVLFRPANPFRVEGAFAKVETVGIKNIAPIDLALGAPPSTLAETAIFKPLDPKTLPGFSRYSETEQILLKERYKTRLSEYQQFTGQIKVTDKKLKEMLKAFDKPHTFSQIGQGRTITMQLGRQEVGGATVLKYKSLKVGDKTLIKPGSAPRAIGTDYDVAAIIDKNTRQLLPKAQLNVAEAELQRLGEKAAVEKGYANPFHGNTASGSDAYAEDYPFFAFYWLQHLKEADAIREAQRLAANYNRGRKESEWITSVQILSKTGGLFERRVLRISASDASFGPANVVFRTPVVAPR